VVRKETLVAGAGLAVLLGGALYFFSPYATRIKEGGGAPDLDLPLLSDSKRVRVAHMRGMPLLLFFFRSDERWSEGQLSQLQATYQDYGPMGLRILGVAFDEDPSVTEKLVKKRKVTFPVATDPGGVVTRASYGTRHLPEAYLVGQSGRVAAVFSGPAAWRSSEVQEALVRALPAGVRRVK